MSKMSYKSHKSGLEGKIAGLYDLEETIGKGHFAVVKLGRHVSSREKVAVKVIDKTKLDDISKSHLFQEVSCMKLVQHPNVVRLYEVIETQTKLYLVLELGDGGDMYDYISSKHQHGLDEDTARQFFRQIIHAINYCHKLHVVHRDLKLENVVIFEKLGLVKLTDFGFSRKFVPGRKLETSCGSLAYSAPEILLGDSYDAPAIDVWSLGVILYMIVCGELPFQEANDSETLTMIMDCKYRKPTNVSSDCQDLIGRMLVREPSQRVQLSAILDHSWLQQGSDVSTPITPLISREHISDKDHAYILQFMVDRKLASKADILQALESNTYDHISATYFLLAERLLRQQRDQGGAASSPTGAAPTKINNAGSATAEKRKDGSKPALAPLALSPRVKSVEPPNCGRPNVESLVSPPGTRTPLTPTSAPGRGRSQSPADRSGTLAAYRCSLIQEASIEEDEEDVDMEEEEVELYSRHGSPRRSVKQPSLDESSDDSERSGGEFGGLPRRPHAPVRPLHTVRSSPQLLNQIFEEGESEDDVSGALPAAPRFAHSPGALYEKPHRRPSSRGGANYSSSDTSDTDDPDGSRRRETPPHSTVRAQRRRDSSDHSSDTDGGSALGGTGRRGVHRHHHAHTDNNNSTSKHSSPRSNKTGGGSRGRQNTSGSSTPSGGSLLGKRDSSCGAADPEAADVGRKISNISNQSITSNMSNMSLTSLNSRSSKYLIDSPDGASDTQAGTDLPPDVEAMNQENHARSRIIHVRSKNFRDLMEQFAQSGGGGGGHREQQLMFSSNAGRKEVRFRRRPKDKVKTDINRNGLIAHADCTLSDSEVKEQSEQRNNVAKTKCCSVI